MRRPTAEDAEEVFSTVAVFAFGVAVGLTAFALHGGVPTCPTIGGKAIGGFCSKWAWGERMAWRSLQVMLLSFAAAFVAARWEAVQRHLSGGGW